MPSRLKRHNESNHIHFWTHSTYRRLQFFHDDRAKQIVIDGLQLIREKHGICLLGYVVMLEHVHVVLLPQRRGNPDPIPISTVLHNFKQHVGFHVKQRLREVWKARAQLWSMPLNDWALGRFDSQKIWITRGYDRHIVSESELIEKLEYCHKNPVKRDLVAAPEDWLWSSYRFL
jgi:putative transposase